jgi:hypothetical protein
MQMSAASPFLVNLQRDLIEAAASFDVDADQETIARELGFWGPAFFEEGRSWVQLRFNQKPGKKASLNWRCEILMPPSTKQTKRTVANVERAEGGSGDALRMPWEMMEGYSKLDGNSCTSFQRPFGNLISTMSCELTTYAIGLDFDVKIGLAKAWHFGNHTVAEIYARSVDDDALAKELPVAGRKHLEFFDKFGFDDVYCTGVDYCNNSMNFYFIFSGTFGRSVEDVKNILAELGFSLPTDEADPERLLLDCSRASAFAVTLRWESDRIERVCFYTPKYLLESTSTIEFAARHVLPTTRDHRTVDSFIGCSFGGDGHYKKIETDYSRSYFKFLNKMIDRWFHEEDKETVAC